jgi:hypothetical protein
MCNDYEQHVSWAGYCKMMQDMALRVARHPGANDLPWIDDIRINEVGPVMRAARDEIELVPMSFSFPPGRPGGAPVFNFRSEGPALRRQHALRRTRIGLLRIYRQEISEGKAAVRPEGRVDDGDCRSVAAGEGQPASVFCDVDDSTRSRCRALSQPSGRGVASRGLGGVDSSDQDRGRTAAAAFGGFA